MPIIAPLLSLIKIPHLRFLAIPLIMGLIYFVKKEAACFMEKHLGYRACIFDLDGTLANTLYSIAHFGNTALKAFGFSTIAPENYRTLVGNGADVLMQRMLSAVGASLSPEELLAFRREYDRLYESDPMKLVTAYDGLPQLISQLKEMGFMLGVLSNKPDNMTRFIVEKLYGGLFHRVQGQLPDVPKKPNPQAVLDMAAGFRLSPREILYVGDSGVDMQTGLNGGMDPCGVLWGFRSKEELLENGAKYLVKNAGELLAVATSEL